MHPKIAAVIPTETGEIIYTISLFKWRIFNNTRYTSFPKRIPAKMPPIILTVVVIIDSINNILARCPFPIPKIL